MRDGDAPVEIPRPLRYTYNMVRICFVCMGNICRSPTAEGIMRSLVEDAKLDGKIFIDSAGTGGWHAGAPPDRRSAATAKGRGIILNGQARRFEASDFADFDYVLALDNDNYRDLISLAGNAEERQKIHLLRSFDSASPKDAGVPDPYYGGDRGFEEVFDICDAACRGLLDHLKQNHGLMA